MHTDKLIKDKPFKESYGSMNLSKCPFDCVMPPQHVFQCLMQDCLGVLNLNYCLIYMDDIVIYSHGIEAHPYHL